jgi:DNA-binding transcriptional LysR family regulator
MDRLDAMRLFTRVVDRRSFTQAAHDLDVPRSTATKVIGDMEKRLGVRLLQRTTRTVRPTLDGEAYYRRCLGILSDVEDAEGAFVGAVPRGTLRIEVQGTLARHFLMPSFPAFLDSHPALDIVMSESDRWVDLVQEGVDCALRYGKLRDSDLVARKVATLERITVATPGYVARHGMPAGLDGLDGHRVVGLRSITTGAVTPLEFSVDGQVHALALASTLSVTGTESYLAGIRLGLGLAQVPRFHVEDELRAGALIQILPAHPVPAAPVWLLYHRSRQLSPRVRTFLDWAAREFALRLPAEETGSLD